MSAKLTPFDGDFAPDKRSKYERFMNAIADDGIIPFNLEAVQEVKD